MARGKLLKIVISVVLGGGGLGYLLLSTAGSHAVAELGELVLLAALLVATWAGAASAVGARRRSRRLVLSGVWAAYGAAALLTLASSLIFFSILANDYAIKYVQHNSEATMPW